MNELYTLKIQFFNIEISWNQNIQNVVIQKMLFNLKKNLVTISSYDVQWSLRIFLNLIKVDLKVLKFMSKKQVFNIHDLAPLQPMVSILYFERA